jgi:hypothetical protein
VSICINIYFYKTIAYAIIKALALVGRILPTVAVAYPDCDVENVITD